MSSGHKTQTGLATDSGLELHDPGRGHPEQPARLAAVVNRLENTGLLADLTPIQPRSANVDELALAHRAEYIELVQREVAQGRTELSTGDTSVNIHSAEAAQLAAGAVICAVDAVFARAAVNAFCAIRPPGHHASARRGMGFCLFNNVAIGARYAQKRFGVQRVLIVDWDVHHGNGTQDIFYSDGSVLFFSTHQWPWYPGTGRRSDRGQGEGEGLTINCPLPAGSGQNEIFAAFRGELLPAAEQFRPDLVMISAGFDSRVGDPLGQFTLTDAHFHELTAMMTELASKYCEGRLVSVLEGGYNLEGLASAAEWHVRGLLGT